MFNKLLFFFSLDLYDEESYDNLKTNDNDNNALRNASEA